MANLGLPSSPIAPFEYTRTGRGKPHRKKYTSFLRCTVDFFTGSWLRSGDSQTTGLRDQLINEQTHIALVSALFLTISSAMMMMADNGNDWPDDWVKGTFTTIVSLGNSFMTISVIISVFVMLAVNETKDDAELRRFNEEMGVLIQSPLLLFILGVANFGGAGCSMWFYATFEFPWFLAISGSSVVCSTIILVPSLIRTVQMTYRARDERFGTVIISGDQVPLALAACVAADETGGEMVTLELFVEYVHATCKTELVAPLTYLRMRKWFEAWQEERANERLGLGKDKEGRE